MFILGCKEGMGLDKWVSRLNEALDCPDTLLLDNGEVTMTSGKPIHQPVTCIQISDFFYLPICSYKNLDILLEEKQTQLYWILIQDIS